MSSKKFNASEKHFQEKEIKLRQELNKKDVLVTELTEINEALIKENTKLLKDLTDTTEKYIKLLEYSKLSEEDIKTALKRDKAITAYAEGMKAFSKFL